ncbi:putative cytochrome b-c1 complex subunit 2, mitochondrial [Penaeus vannamei]|uniref:Putative cytochrome b-c1 complex subunit 2, mitochondrial n=1 Tax=Penaeus vannamei TaxID=6689 RepID=A0A3R7MMN9_PENVA|nr:putative cytochrome b-c1 complex subunit 2, mitochondrial [Penaeus vannamei]
MRRTSLCASRCSLCGVLWESRLSCSGGKGDRETSRLPQYETIMASKLAKPSLLKNVVNRGYAAQAAAQQSYNLPTQDVKVTTLPTGAVVASLENNAPVSRVAVLFKAGSRYETAPNKGAAHVLRTSVGLGTKDVSAFAITRNIQQAGGSLTAESGREHVMYSLDMTRNNLDSSLEVLASVATQPSFKPWELADNLKRIKIELAMRDPSTLALELLHGAAFRNSGLGNSIFVPDYQLGKLSQGVMGDFVASTHLASRMAVVGLGVDHEGLVSYAKSLGVGSGDGVPTVGAYGTQQILGIGPSTKYGGNASSVLAKAVASSGGLGSASAININYSDSGLFGYFIMADSASVDKVIDAVHSAVKGLKVTEADVARGKKMAKAAIHMATESGAEHLEDMGLQALLTGTYANPSAAAAAIDGVTASSVQSAVSKVMGGKLSMGAIGSLSAVPYIDQL